MSELIEFLSNEKESRTLDYLKDYVCGFMYEHYFNCYPVPFYFRLRNKILFLKGKRELIGFVSKLSSLF